MKTKNYGNNNPTRNITCFLYHMIFSVCEYVRAKYLNSLIANKYNKPISGQCPYFILTENTKKVPVVIKFKHWPEMG